MRSLRPERATGAGTSRTQRSLGQFTSIAELRFEQRAQSPRVAFASQFLHRLADEEREQVLLARLVLLHFAGTARDDRVGDLLEGARVGDLDEALLLDDLRRRQGRAQRVREDLAR